MIWLDYQCSLPLSCPTDITHTRIVEIVQDDEGDVISKTVLFTGEHFSEGAYEVNEVREWLDVLS